MKRYFFSYLLLVLLLVFFFLGVWLYSPLLYKHATGLVSPLPDFLVVKKNNQVATLNLFLPVIQDVMGAQTKDGMPEVSAQAALTYDLQTKKLLYEKNITQKVPMASLTKIMTAIIALENQKPDDRYTVSKADLVGEDTMGLEAGEILSLKELLYGLMLHSGNDAAETLASNYSVGRDVFVKAMNEKAQALGLTSTHFTNPSGLQGDGDQYTTAHDLLVITTYAWEHFPLFNTIAQAPEIEILATPTHKAFYLANETNLLTSYPGVKGVKTGYTPEAGLCLITRLEYNGHNIIGILLGSNNRREEMKRLLDYSLSGLGTTPPKSI